MASVPPALGIDHLKVTPSLPPSSAFYAQVSAPGLLALGGQTLCLIPQQRGPRALQLVTSLHTHSVSETRGLANAGRTKEFGHQGKFLSMAPTFQRQITGGRWPGCALDTWSSIRGLNLTSMDGLQRS